MKLSIYTKEEENKRKMEMEIKKIKP